MRWFESEEKSRIPGGDRVTKHYSDRTSEDRDYIHGKLETITDHDSKGNSHSHEVGHGLFGPFKGSKR